MSPSTDPKIYKTAAAFRRALEDRLNSSARSQNIHVTRLRRQVAFERLLARILRKPKPEWLLKGGYAMELRLRDIARGTRDIDLSLSPDAPLTPQSSSDQVRARLQGCAATDLQDWFEFRIGDLMQDLEGAPYAGFRYPVEARMDRRQFVSFHLDVSLGDAVGDSPVWVRGHELLSFAGIEPVVLPLLKSSLQFAEKIHAYTLPRPTPNSRTRDLIDLVLLIEQKLPSEEEMVASLNLTFERRRTHPLPLILASPPQEWEEAYRTMAKETGVTCKTMPEAFKLITNYWRKLTPLLKKEH